MFSSRSENKQIAAKRKDDVSKQKRTKSASSKSQVGFMSELQGAVHTRSLKEVKPRAISHPDYHGFDGSSSGTSSTSSRTPATPVDKEFIYHSSDSPASSILSTSSTSTYHSCPSTPSAFNPSTPGSNLNFTVTPSTPLHSNSKAYTPADGDNSPCDESINVSKMISIWSDLIEKDGAETVFVRSPPRTSTPRVAFGKEPINSKLFVDTFLLCTVPNRISNILLIYLFSFAAFFGRLSHKMCPLGRHVSRRKCCFLRTGCARNKNS